MRYVSFVFGFMLMLQNVEFTTGQDISLPYRFRTNFDALRNNVKHPVDDSRNFKRRMNSNYDAEDLYMPLGFGANSVFLPPRFSLYGK
ncbi:unnamed protein product [Angiostrongylus costaricensis]|uniref:Uncharacterized protein n=1 Tax=Angiostrongylus costaricensis TaxID=334426 RepID=A0A0R3PUP9_ANGCS|nr:unnamed protein product [Angiostrongylus costaricensis]